MLRKPGSKSGGYRKSTNCPHNTPACCTPPGLRQNQIIWCLNGQGHFTASLACFQLPQKTQRVPRIGVSIENLATNAAGRQRAETRDSRAFIPALLCRRRVEICLGSPREMWGQGHRRDKDCRTANEAAQSATVSPSLHRGRAAAAIGNEGERW